MDLAYFIWVAYFEPTGAFGFHFFLTKTAPRLSSKFVHPSPPSPGTDIPIGSSLHVLRSGVSPRYDHPDNVNGGHYVCLC